LHQRIRGIKGIRGIRATGFVDSTFFESKIIQPEIYLGLDLQIKKGLKF